MPTQPQIDQVKKNVKNMIDLSNHVQQYLQPKVNEVYQYLSADAETDSGYGFVCALIETAFGLAAAVEFPGAAVVGAFLPIFFSAASPQDVSRDLKIKFGAVWARLDKTFLDANDQLAKIHDDPAAYWDTTYTSPVNGSKTLVSSLGDAGVQMPGRASSPFQQITDLAINQFRLDLTRSILPSLYYVYFSDYYSGYIDGDMEQFVKFASKYVASYPPYFFKQRRAFRMDGSKHINVIQYYNFSLVKTSGSIFSVPSKDLCNWLMKDDGYGNNTNPDGDGVATRAAVFFEWGLRVYYPNGKPIGIDQAWYGSAASMAAAPEELKVTEGPKPPPPPSAEGAK